MDIETSKLFFQIIRIGLGTEKADGDTLVGFRSLNTHDSAMWKSMCDMGVKQGVAAFLFDGLQILKKAEALPTELMPPKEVLMRLYSHTLQVEKNCNKHKVAIHNLAKFYNKHGIKMMLLKGYGLSLLYPNPAHRPCGDIDIWQYGEQEKGDKLLQEKGIVIDSSHHHHTVFHINGVMVENHYDFINIHAHLSNRDMEQDLQELAREKDYEITVTGEKAYLPPATFNALFLLRHAGAHFSSTEITLRNVADWVMFVKYYHKEIDWYVLENIVHKYALQDFYHCLNDICISYLGLPKVCSPSFDCDKTLSKRIMQDILNPRFAEEAKQKMNVFTDAIFRFRRWWGNRWKHRLIHHESLFVHFFILLRSHFIKPEGKHNSLMK